LTPEERAIFTLGKNAERFLAADREAREIRERRDLHLGRANSNHWEDTPCYQVGIEERHDWDEGDEDTDDAEQLPVSDWCDECRYYVGARQEAFFAYHKRRSARQALTATYRRLLRLRIMLCKSLI
jgi:hypothetical protein